MKKFLFASSVLLNLAAAAQTFDIVPLGVYGGEREDNLSSYLISQYQKNEFLALDAGTINAGIRKAIALKTFDVEEEKVLRDYIKGYFISHGHLDHLSGLVINSPADSKKNIYAIPFVQDILVNYYFSKDTWVNFTDKGNNPIGKYQLIPLQLGAEHQVTGTGLSIKAFELSHTKDYKSSAVLVGSHDDYILYLGDTGADRIENSKNLEILWKSIAPLIKNKQLKAIMIEVSFPNSQPENLLFGHLTPNLLQEEFLKLSSYTGQENLKGLKIIITHIKPSGKNPEIIKQELQQNNPLQLQYIYPVQGSLVSF